MIDDDDTYETDDFFFTMASNETVFTLLYVLLTVSLLAPPTEFIQAGLTIQMDFGSDEDDFLADDFLVTMATPETVFTLLYVLFGLALVAPPTEFISAGITVQGLLANYLGSEDLHFIAYHIRRTTATAIFHSFLPLGYFLGLIMISAEDHWLSILWRSSTIWNSLLLFSCLLPATVLAISYYWSRNKWANHPIARALAHHATEGSSWHAVASSISLEFRRIHKFTSGMPGRRVIVTDSWIILTGPYTIRVANQGDVHLTLAATDEHHISPDSGPGGAQYLNILVASVDARTKPFTIRLNSLEYSDLQEKLSRPVRNARDVVIRTTISDRFLDAFREQIQENRPFRKPPDMELEQCIGCMQTVADVTLVKLCDNMEAGHCQQCYCRPMWCLECMGKWFASRQDPDTPGQWMASRAPCPTCRAKFCMLDVCRIQI